MKEAIHHGVRSGMFQRRGDFLWRPGHQNPDVRLRDGKLPAAAKALKKIEMIAPQEIGLAVFHAVNDSFGISEDEAIKEACRLFGFQRTGKKITDRMQGIVDTLLRAGTLKRSGDLLCVPDGAGSS